MSNHSGRYMLNSMLARLERESYFSDIGPEKTEEFVGHVRALAWGYDGNPDAVLHGIDERLGMCDTCFKMSHELHDGTCISVRSTSIRHGDHGYRLEDEDDMRSLVLKEWTRRGQRADD